MEQTLAAALAGAAAEAPVCSPLPAPDTGAAEAAALDAAAVLGDAVRACQAAGREQQHTAARAALDALRRGG